MTTHMSYADAGVDVSEGARAVDAIKEACAATRSEEHTSELQSPQ